jgi:hypothetical protein
MAMAAQTSVTSIPDILGDCSEPRMNRPLAGSLSGRRTGSLSERRIRSRHRAVVGRASYVTGLVHDATPLLETKRYIDTLPLRRHRGTHNDTR